MKMKKIGGMGGRMAIVLSGLLLLFAACEKDVLPRGSGRKVAIKFVIGGTGDAVRGFNVLEMKPKTTVVHLRDSLYMYAKLVPDDVEDGVKAATTSLLVEGQHVHMEAYYVSDGTSAGSADYHANAAGNLVLDDPDYPLEVDPALGPFHFTAYSYYKSTDPISETAIDPSAHDLIWGEATNQTIDETETGRTVTMVLKHCFSRVRVKINVAGILNTTITDVGTISIGGLKADLDVSDGSLTPTATAVTQTISSWPDLTWPFSEEEILSDYAVVYPSPTVVTIGSITLDIDGDVRTITRSASFTETLTPGQHYTLVIDMKPLIWAQSNIFWNGSALAFEKPGDSPAHKDYQGVSFQVGSLIGMDPGFYTISYPNTNTIDDRILFVPPTNGEASWVTPKLGDTIWKYASSHIHTPFGGDTTDDQYYSSYLGDICRYLSENLWRTPSQVEFGGVENYKSPITYSTSVGSSGRWDGRSLCGARGVWDASQTVFFPDPVYDVQNSGLSYERHGTYTTTTGWFQLASNGTIGRYTYSNSAGGAASIRCVKNN
jgi:hypothetical protein